MMECLGESKTATLQRLVASKLHPMNIEYLGLETAKDFSHDKVSS